MTTPAPHDLPYHGELCPVTGLPFDGAGGTKTEQTAKFKQLVSDPNWRAFMATTSPEIFKRVRYEQGD